ncbi:ATP-binding protein [Streptomyces sp. NPDC057798]|uniref:ATP-binding protein n=1 Tax=Streptomyces sp. NPDC057798 TaxID=3346252 RepID=UPI00368EB34D
MRRQQNCVPRGTSLPLDHTPQAPRRARRHTSTTLHGWGLSPAAVDDAVLIVSELVTNAYLHARTETVGLELLLDAGQLVISCTTDPQRPSTSPHPVTRPAATTAEAWASFARWLTRWAAALQQPARRYGR